MVNSAFVSLTPALPRTSVRAARVSPRMAAAPKPNVARRAAARLAALPASLVATAPVWATEGTGEGLGIDSPLLWIPLVLIPGAFLILFIQFGRSQDNSDFLGGYDERRN